MDKEHLESLELPSLEQIRTEQERLRRKKSGRHRLWGTIAILIVVAAFAFLIATLVCPVYRIYGNSMAPTLSAGDIVVCLKTEDYEAGDMAAFYVGNKLQIKRLIGRPTDWIQVEEDGTVLVNSNPISEPYISEKALGESNISYPFQTPEGKWFVMGDNRPTSVDSRNTALGCVSVEALAGRVVFRIWPLERFGLIE